MRFCADISGLLVNGSVLCNWAVKNCPKGSAFEINQNFFICFNNNLVSFTHTKSSTTTGAILRFIFLTNIIDSKRDSQRTALSKVIPCERFSFS